MEPHADEGAFVELGAAVRPEPAGQSTPRDAGLRLGPRTGPAILDLSLEVVMGRAVACVGICALLWFPVRALMPWFVAWNEGGAWAADTDSIVLFLGFSLGFVLVQMLVGNVSMTAVTLLVHGELVGQPVGALEALTRTLRRAPALLGLFLANGSLLAFGVSAIVIGSLLCPIFMPLALVYYVFLTWRFSVAAAVLILEDAGVFESMGRSWSLTHGSFWRWVTVSVLSTALVIWFAGFLQVGDNLTIRGAVLESMGIPSMLFDVLFVAISALFSGVANAISSAALTTYYFDTRTRKEGFDLSMRLERQIALCGAGAQSAAVG